MFQYVEKEMTDWLVAHHDQIKFWWCGWVSHPGQNMINVKVRVKVIKFQSNLSLSQSLSQSRFKAGYLIQQQQQQLQNNRRNRESAIIQSF